MRLHILEHGHRLRVRLLFAVVARLSGVPMSDVPKTLLYRPEFFGRHLLELSADAMRGPSFWTAGEREYMATCTARLHQSPYCLQSHAELTRVASGGAIDPIDGGGARPELTAVLDFLEQVTVAPSLVPAYDMTVLAGLSDDAIGEALRVNYVWNIINRLANAFDFQLLDGQLEKGTRALHRLGYRFPRFFTGPRRRSPQTRPIVTDPWAVLVARVRGVVLDPVAKTDPATRAAAAGGLRRIPGPPDRVASYAEMVRDHSHRVSEADIRALAVAGRTEDEIFEITVAAAIGAAQQSLDAGLRAIGGRAIPT